MQQPTPGEPITKWITAKNTRWAWSTPDAILLNETLCLHRLRGTRGFPTILETNWDAHSITMTWQGPTLHWYWKRGLRPTVTNPLEQLQTLFGHLEAQGIAHLDLGVNGKNLCLYNGELSIIDFGVAVRDGKPTSERLRSLLAAFHSQGGYEHLLHLHLSQLYQTCTVKKTSAKRQR